MEPPGPWVSASDLAEYAYCPRSHWYSTHPEEVPVGTPVDPRARRGQRYHQRTLAAERDHDRHVGRYIALLLIGLALLAGGALLFGGL